MPLLPELHMQSWTLLIICVTVATKPDFLKTPGTVSVIRGGPSLLSFQPSLNNDQISWCYWKYAGCERPEGCTTESFIGYTILDKHQREEISRRHEGWIFENARNPCQGGIQRETTDQDHKGWYQMIYEDMDNREYPSDFFSLILYESNILDVAISINNKSKILTLSDNERELPSIVGVKNENYVFSLTLQSGLPPGANVCIQRSNSDETTMVIPRCAGTDDPTCDFVVGLSEEKDVAIEFIFDTSLQGLSLVEVKQSFNYDGISTAARDAAIACAVLFALLSVLSIIVFLLLLRWLNKRRKNKLDAENVPLIKDLKRAKTRITELEKELNSVADELKTQVENQTLLNKEHEDEKRELTRQLNDTIIRLLDAQKEVESQRLENTHKNDEIRTLTESKDTLREQLEGRLKSVEGSKERLKNQTDKKIKDLEIKVAELGVKQRMAPEIFDHPKVFNLKPDAQNEKIKIKIKTNTEPDVKFMQEERRHSNLERVKVNAQGLSTNLTRMGDVYIWTLSIKELKQKFARKYHLVATNQHGSDTVEFDIAISEGAKDSRQDYPTASTEAEARNVDQTGLPITRPLSITRPLADCKIISRKSLELSVKAEGKEPLSATWFKDEREVKQSAYTTLWTGADGEFTLKIKYATRMDAGRYKCVITDGNKNTETTEATVDVEVQSCDTSSCASR